jgi:hypothetical protein
VCSAEVTFRDKNTEQIIIFGNSDLNVSSTMLEITFTNERLQQDRQYGFTLNASNINASAFSNGDISKSLKSMFDSASTHIIIIDVRGILRCCLYSAGVLNNY